MLSLEQILNPPPPKPLAPGNHSDVAERFRVEALHRLGAMRLYADALEMCVRDRPNDDASFDGIATSLLRTVREAGLFVDAFRDTRDVAGEA